LRGDFGDLSFAMPNPSVSEDVLITSVGIRTGPTGAHHIRDCGKCKIGLESMTANMIGRAGEMVEMRMDLG
jgi:hypothetical protein